MAQKYALGHLLDISVHLVYENDEFIPHFKDANHTYDTFEFNPPKNCFVDRGKMVGGFAYISYENPAQNKLVVMSKADIDKRLGYESHSIISNYERYALIALDQDTKQRYADILGIPIQALYKEPVEMPVHPADIDQTVCRINLESIRKAHGKSIADFAEELGISDVAYRSYSRGGVISLQSFWIIVDHLDIDPWLLATGKTHKEG